MEIEDKGRIGAYILLNETDDNECFYLVGAFADRDNAIRAAQSINPSSVDYIDDWLTINVRHFDGLINYERSKIVFSIEWRTKYNEDTDEYEWVKL